MSKKYIKVYEDLKLKISTGVFCNEEKLPTNSELAVIYNVSIITIKRSLGLLKDEKLIYSVSGVGTFVSFNDVPEWTKHKLKLSLIVPDFSEAFCLEIVNTFEKICRNNNIMPIISRTFGSSELENRIILEHLEHGTDGICIMPIHDEYFNKELLKLSLNRFPVVTIDRTLPSVQLSSVTTDNRASSEALAQHVTDEGYSFPLVVTPTFKNSHILTQRVINFIKHFERHKILNYDNYIPEPNQKFDVEQQNLMKKNLLSIIKDGIDVIFCVEYNIASDVKRIIDELNLSIEIVCFDYPVALDNILFTHIKQNQANLAATAYEVLISQVKLNTKISHLELPGTLVIKNI